MPVLDKLAAFVQTDQEGGETLKGQRAEARIVLGDNQFEAVLSIDLAEGSFSLLVQNLKDRDKVRSLATATVNSVLRPIL